MANIILQTGKMKAYEMTMELGKYIGQSELFMNELWDGLMDYPPVYEEYVYYLEHQDILGEYEFRGITLLDVFVSQMKYFNLRHDTGKNTSDCNKVEMVISAFYVFLQVHKDPKTWLSKVNAGRGMDFYGQ
ncbi:MAG: hypothetical protein LUH19_09330 [Lachnospiraceae bacterium]|nr:hypothetical protein [Lachnospiraceae bacterium]